jgi:hypothetical protein
MTTHLLKFIERVQGYDSRGSKDFIMSMADAKNLHADITRLLLELNDLRETRTQTAQDSVISVQMDGGSF